LKHKKNKSHIGGRRGLLRLQGNERDTRFSDFGAIPGGSSGCGVPKEPIKISSLLRLRLWWLTGKDVKLHIIRFVGRRPRMRSTDNNKKKTAHSYEIVTIDLEKVRSLYRMTLSLSKASSWREMLIESRKEMLIVQFFLTELRSNRCYITIVECAFSLRWRLQYIIKFKITVLISAYSKILAVHK